MAVFVISDYSGIVLSYDLITASVSWRCVMCRAGVRRPTVNAMEQYCRERSEQMGLTLEPGRYATVAALSSSGTLQSRHGCNKRFWRF